MKNTRGILVTFEGTEGAGKSTLIRTIESRIGLPTGTVVLTREPGGNRVAEKIRSIILNDAMDPWTEIFLYEAARAEHIAKTIRPALIAGKLVLCDRFTDSSLAYQAYARGLAWERIKTLNQLATQGRSPDMTVFLDIDPAIGLKRANDRNRFEAEGLEFQKRVRKGFLKIRREEPKRWLTVNAGSLAPDDLAEIVIAELHRRFMTRFKHWHARRPQEKSNSRRG